MDHIPRLLRTWIEVDKKAIAHNYRLFRKFIGTKAQFMGVVKSNAYGHNLIEFSRELEILGIDWFGVDSITEALALRKEKIKTPILVLGHTLPELYGEAVAHDISITVSSLPQLKNALKISLRGKKFLKIHIKADTGMHRQGFQLHEKKELVALLKKPRPGIVVEGLYTHLAEAKNPRSSDNARRQLKEFDEWITAFTAAGMTPIIHAAATGGTLLYPRAHYDMVRIGIGGYGLWPSEDAERFLSSKVSLKPVLAWRAKVGEVKEVQKGERVGYDFTEMLTRNSTLAVIPVGYWHGFPRLLSGRGRVLIHGKSARVIGRVSMDMIVVDVTDIPKVKMGDVVTLIGRDGRGVISTGEIAKFAATTHYEIVTRLNPLMKKYYR